MTIEEKKRMLAKVAESAMNEFLNDISDCEMYEEDGKVFADTKWGEKCEVLCEFDINPYYPESI